MKWIPFVQDDVLVRHCSKQSVPLLKALLDQHEKSSWPCSRLTLMIHTSERKKERETVQTDLKVHRGGVRHFQSGSRVPPYGYCVSCSNSKVEATRTNRHSLDVPVQGQLNVMNSLSLVNISSIPGSRGVFASLCFPLIRSRATISPAESR